MVVFLTKMLALLMLLCGLAACASTNHQKNASWLFGVYQAEYYDQARAERQ